jgi:hypothetical protein
MSKAVTYKSSISIDDSTKTLLVIGGVAAVGLVAWFYSRQAASSVASALPSSNDGTDSTPNLPVVQTWNPTSS